jgi:hypothetical protein
MAVCITAVAGLVAMPALAAERPSDKDVRALLERVDNDRDRFEDQLDGKVKDSIIRGPGGEVNVGRFLDDLQENVDKMKDRFKPDYAGSAEVTTVLRQGSDISRFMAQQPANFGGSSEWNRLAAGLAELATVYGTTFPLAEGRQARRANDGEVKKTADESAKSADRFKNELESSLRNDKAVDTATRDARVREADSLKEDAKKLASLVGDGRPASAEAQVLLDRGARVRTASSGHALSTKAQTEWTAVQSGLEGVAQAFNTRVP